MAISVDWGTKIITVPKADTTLVSLGPPEIRSLNVDTFRLELKALEDDVDGMVFPITHNHTAPVTVGGVTLARVVEIINGYTVTFENGSYAVNLQGANNNIGDVLNLNNVQVRSNNSAGLTFSKQVEDQSFLDGRLFIDTVNGQTGTSFPLGTPGAPVNNLADAQTIIAARTLPKRLFLRGTLVVANGESLADYNVAGTSALLSFVNFQVGSDATSAVLSGVTVLGAVAGGVRMTKNCILGVTSVFEGSMVDSALAAATTTLTNTDAQDIIGFFNCTSIVAGTGKPVLDCNGVADLELNVRNYSGGLQINNFNLASQVASIDVNSGSVLLDSTCTAGTIVVRGTGDLTDNSGAGCTVVSVGFVEAANIDELWKLQGLDIDNPMTVTPTSRDAGASVSQSISGDATTTTTVTRNP